MLIPALLSVSMALLYAAISTILFSKSIAALPFLYPSSNALHIL